MRLRFLFLAAGILFFILLTVNYSSAVSPVSFFFNTSMSNNSVLINDQIIYSSSVMLQIITDKFVTCKYSDADGIPYNAMEGSFDYNLGNLHKRSFSNLEDGLYRKYIRCQNSSGYISPQLEAVYSIVAPVSATIGLSKSSPLNAGQVEIELTTSKILSETPTLSYSFDGSDYSSIPVYGSGNSWNAYLIIPKDLGDVVGSFKFSGKDLEGITGTEIKSGSVFLVDTIPPSTITNIKATGLDGLIKLEWSTDEEISKYKIYRSDNAGVKQVDFYKEISSASESYTDTAVERGKNYFYKISAIDEAGNEGDLSVEVSATVLFSNSSSNQKSGLDIQLIGFVDGMLSSINSAESSINEISSSWESKAEKEKKLFSELKLEREISGAKSELDSLKREVELYKAQALTKNDLEKKLNSAELKLITIKKRIPESLIISGERSIEKSVNSDSIEKVILSLKPDISKKLMDKSLESSVELIEEFGFKSKSEAYNLELIYMDGSRRNMAFFKESIETSLDDKEETLFFIIFPPGFIEVQADLDVKNTNYNIVKEAEIISFPSDTRSIVFSANKHLSLQSLEDIKLAVVKEENEEIKSGFLTGYSVFSDFKNNNLFGLGLGILVISALAGYFIFLKYNGKKDEALSGVLLKIEKINNCIDKEDYVRAKKIYEDISKSYEKLDSRNKSKVHKSLEEVYDLIHTAYCKSLLSEADSVIKEDFSKAKSTFEKASEIYSNLSDKSKNEIYDGLNDLRERLGNE